MLSSIEDTDGTPAELLENTDGISPELIDITSKTQTFSNGKYTDLHILDWTFTPLEEIVL